MEDPSLVDLLDTLFKVINVLVLVSGIIFVGVLAYGAFKAAMSLGNPRGLEAAKQTWTYGLYGFLVVVGYFAIFTIATGLFGSTADPVFFLSQIKVGLSQLIGIMTVGN